MREQDIIVGEKYRMKTELADFVKEGVIVKVLSVDGDSVYVQDLSRNKCLDGKWFVLCDDLQPLKGIDPEEIKVGLRVNHKDCGAGTVTFLCGTAFLVRFDNEHPRFCRERAFALTLEDDRWSCAALSLITAKDSSPKVVSYESVSLTTDRITEKVTATLGETQASASCKPDDIFDPVIGTQIALARLAHKCGKPVTVYVPKDTKDFKIEFV